MLVLGAMAARGVPKEDMRSAWRDWTRFDDFCYSPPDVLQGVFHALSAPEATATKGSDGRWRIFIRGYMFYGPQNPDAPRGTKERLPVGESQHDPQPKNLF
jgi:hypothetical protein